MFVAVETILVVTKLKNRMIRSPCNLLCNEYLSLIFCFSWLEWAKLGWFTLGYYGYFIMWLKCLNYLLYFRWDTQLNSIADSKLKELFPVVPVIFIKAITQDKQDLRNMYDCPVYKTRMRGPTFVWTFNLKSKETPLKWTLAGVAILLQI